MPLRVLHVVPNIDPRQGGPARSVVSLVNALRQLDDLHVTLAAAGDPERADVSLHVRGRWSLLNRESRQKLRDAVEQADVVELHSIWNDVISFAAKTCRMLGKPYLYTPRGMLDPYCLRTRAWLKRLTAWLGEEKNIAGAAGFHLLSQEERDGLVKARPYLADRPFVIAPNGLGDVPDDYPKGLLVTKFPETVGRKTVLFLGRLDEIKGLKLPIEALSMIPAAARPMILLVGPDFGVEASLKALAARLGVAPWVIFAGPIYDNDRFSLLAEADLVALTSHYDCNPVTATEAFAVGGAVIATEGSGLRQARDAGAAAVVPRTVLDFARELQTLLADDPRRAMLRRSALLYATRTLRWPRLLEPLVALYYQLTRANSSGQSAPCS
jgi:glycosyltransferase involved in cell wall biosynthesis